MHIVLFHQSFTSRWDHGNTRFLRSMARTLTRLGHTIVVYEPADPRADRSAVRAEETTVHSYSLNRLDLDRALESADAVIVHEGNSSELVRRVGKRRQAGGRFQLLFHDAHHRTVTEPNGRGRIALDAFDAVLAGGEVLRQ